MPLQVASELKKMTAFIKQEALEKAREIQLKADEEFAIEKSKLVRSETSSIDGQYEKKFKQASMSQQITRSTMANKTRLKVLSARQALLDDLFEQTRGKIGDVSRKGSYEGILKALLLEGLYALNEPQVQVRVRKADNAIVRRAIEAAKKDCQENLGKDVDVEIDDEDPLPDRS
jgi:V-type H+-transporting ATPase subunit E